MDKGIFLGYSSTSKAYRVYKKRTLIVEESVHVAFDKTPSQVAGKGTSFDVAGIDTKGIVEDGDQQEAPPKDEDNKDKEFAEYFHEDEK